MRKTKVLLLLHDLSPTGAPKLVLTAFEHLQESVELRTMTYQGGALRGRVRALGPVQTLVSYSWPGMPAAPRAVALFLVHRFLSLAKARVWSRAIGRWKPDLVYVNSITALLAAKRLSLPPAPVLLHVHELDSFLYPFSQNAPELLRGLPDRYLAVSEAVRTALIERYYVPPEKIRVIPAFVDDTPLPASSAFDPQAPLIVGGAGVVSWVKGPELWLLMAARIKQRLGKDRVRFVWVGLPESEDGWRFREMARKLSLTEDIEMVPFTPRPLDYYAQFDVFALSSWEESASLAILENMLLETPVVCFRGAGGPAELVGPAGVVVDEFSPFAMADAVIELLSSPERRAALGQAGRVRVREQFTAARQVPLIWNEIQQSAAKTS